MTPGDRRSGRLPAGDDLMLDECAGTIAEVGAGLGADVCVVEMDAADLGRIREIDRSESVRRKHVYDRGELRPVEINHEIPRWSEEMVAEATEMLAPKLAAGGVLLGAFAGDTLVGVAVLGSDFNDAQSNKLQLVYQYVKKQLPTAQYRQAVDGRGLPLRAQQGCEAAVHLGDRDRIGGRLLLSLRLPACRSR